MRYVSREEMQNLDQTAIQKYQIPGIILMENAGAGATRIFMQHITNGPVAIICGKGNNGGDGFVIARHLYNNNIPVYVYFIGDIDKVKADSDAGINLNILENMGIPVAVINGADSLAQDQNLKNSEVIVDAIFGTGLSGEIRNPIAQIIETINRLQKPIFAVDIPSGMDSNTGEILGVAIQAKLTTTFALPKKGFQSEQARKLLGELHIVEISIPRFLLEISK